MNRTRTVLVTTVALAAALLAVPTAARAEGDPAGTIVLANGPSPFPKAVTLQAATSNSVVFADERGLVVQRTDQRKSSVLTPRGIVSSSAGSLVLYLDDIDGTEHWYNTANGRTGIEQSSWDSAAPTGGLIVTRINRRTVRVSLQNAVSGVTRILANVPYAGPDGNFFARSGPDGAVITYDPGFEGGGSTFVGYVSYAGGGLRSYDLGAIPEVDLGYIRCSVNSTTIACTSAGGNDVFGVPISGTAASVIGQFESSCGVSLSSTAIGWLKYQSDPDTGATQFVLQSMPITGGPTTSGPIVNASTFEDAINDCLLTDGTTFFVNLGQKTSTAGVYTTPDAATTPSRVVALGAAPYRASGIAITPGGRVVLSDNRRTSYPLWQQTLERTTGGVAMTSEVLLTTHARGVLTSSGARTGYEDSSGSYFVTSPLQSQVDHLGSGQVSGTRVLFQSFDGATVLDLNTGDEMATSTFGDPGTASAIWGDYDTFVKDDGSVWRKDLTSAAEPTSLLPGAASTFTQGIAVWADWVAVDRYNSTSGELITLVLNTRTGAQRQENAEFTTSVNAAGYVEAGTTLHSWDGTHSVRVSGSGLMATSSLLVWIGPDDRPRAAPVPWTTPDPPRSLGNPLAPATVGTGGVWTFDLPTSAPLVACSVDLLKGATVVRTLACDSAYTGGGDAVVRWDTRDANGNAAPLGAYTWRVTAANADGPLTVKGKVAITRAG